MQDIKEEFNKDIEKNEILDLKNTKSNVVAHVCNHSYLGGRD
jgi:hypothetical protein